MVVSATVLVEAGGHVTEARAETYDDPSAACLERALTERIFPDPGRTVRHRVAHEFVLGHH